MMDSPNPAQKMTPETTSPARRRTPWVTYFLTRSIWKDDETDLRLLARCEVKPIEGRKKTISIHMGKPLLGESIEVLNLSVRSSNCLKRCGIRTIEDLMGQMESEADLLRIRNLGRKSAEEILTKLERYQALLLAEQNTEKSHSQNNLRGPDA